MTSASKPYQFQAFVTMSPPADDDGPDEADRPGDAPCLLRRVCPDCGSVADADPPTTCPQCGAALPPG